jgi:hypothetical protein
LVLLALGLLASGCEYVWTPDVQSDYFVVTFAPNSTQLTPEGTLALGNAADDAQRSAVSRITIGAFVNPAASDAASDQIVQQRVAVVQDALQRAGTDPQIIQRHDRSVDQQTFTAMRDGINIQIQIGSPSPPEEAPAESE